jgi:hypothetical protein
VPGDPPPDGPDPLDGGGLDDGGAVHVTPSLPRSLSEPPKSTSISNCQRPVAQPAASNGEWRV